MIKLISLGILISVGLPTVAAAEDKTCGQMLAEKAVLPAKMAEVMTAVTKMLDAHAKFMGKSKEGKKEAAALSKLAKTHKDLATRFGKASEEMKKLYALPGAPHDLAKMSADPKIGEAMKDMLRTHKEMVALLQKEIAEMESQGGATTPAAPAAGGGGAKAAAEGGEEGEGEESGASQKVRKGAKPAATPAKTPPGVMKPPPIKAPPPAPKK